MKILGIDPALTCLGWGIIRLNSPKIEYVDSGIVKTTAKELMWHRLSTISSSIEAIIELYKPDAIAMEETFINKNPTSSLKLGYVRGALMATIGKTNLPYFEFLNAQFISNSALQYGGALYIAALDDYDVCKYFSWYNITCNLYL